VTDPTYLDANPLIYWAAGRAGSADAKDQRGLASVEALLASKAPIAVSPITLAEFSSVLHKLVRREEPPHDFFDIDDAVAAEQGLMDLLATGRVIGRNLGARAFEAGMSYVAAATREYRRKVYAWDAIHIYEAARWARELERPVFIGTSDADFQSILAIWPEFGAFVSIVELA
jgi:hypothetical protein